MASDEKYYVRLVTGRPVVVRHLETDYGPAWQYVGEIHRPVSYREPPGEHVEVDGVQWWVGPIVDPNA